MVMPAAMVRLIRRADEVLPGLDLRHLLAATVIEFPRHGRPVSAQDKIMVFKAQAVAERKLRCHACMYSHCLKACASCMAPKTGRRRRKNSTRKAERRSRKNSNRETGRRSCENSGRECLQNAFRIVSECFQSAPRMLPERFPECLQTSVLNLDIRTDVQITSTLFPNCSKNAVPLRIASLQTSVWLLAWILFTH